VFFKLSEKQPVVLWKNRLFYTWEFLERLKTVFMVDLLSKPKQLIDLWKQPIFCFGTITENCFVL